MKTKLIAIVTMLVVVLGITKSTYAATDDNTTPVLKNISKVNKIEVRGNVLLYVSSGDNEKIKVYNHSFDENVLVQNKNGVLRITSYKTEKLVVWVTANELKNIITYDNAEVMSFGKLNSNTFITKADIDNASDSAIKKAENNDELAVL